MFSFEKELDTAETLADCCNAYQNEFIRIQNIQGWAAAVTAKYNLRYEAALRYVGLRPEVLQEYNSVEDVMQLIY
ncbi:MULTISPECIES: hypothetical protein [Lactococcus]|uniref:Phage protein n=1 Tax=Lactococcus garvieae TaxID=1363 RepID=H2B2R5_9LACT|nr:MULTISPECIES: hypothetical protein [Lactococcus]CCF71024.1 hypothetical protein [Lactococcus garvieae]